MVIYNLIRQVKYEVSEDEWVDVESFDSMEKALQALRESYQNEIQQVEENEKVIDEECGIYNDQAWILIEVDNMYGKDNCIISYCIKQCEVK